MAALQPPTKEKAGNDKYLDKIVDRKVTSYAKERGLCHLCCKHKSQHMRIILLYGSNVAPVLDSPARPLM